MKIIDLPTRLFETGDRVLTPEGPGTVIHDELEGIITQYVVEGTSGTSKSIIELIEIRKRIAEHSYERDAVIVRLDDENPSGGRQEIELDRTNLMILKPKE
jgi:hypothetical protein